jgi:diguanylate cyclase (GGDEF)-like protein
LPFVRSSIFARLLVSHVAVILLVSGSVGSYVYSNATETLMQSLKARLRNSAALISQGFDASGLDAIRSPADTETEVYRQSVRDLRRLARTDPDIAFVYVMRRVGEKVEFVVDSDVEAPAMPGEEYPHRLPALLEGFQRPSVDPAITADRWGHFLSGYSPLLSSEGVYLVGIDMRADTVHAKFGQLRFAYLLSLVAAVPVALAVSAWLARGFTRRIRRLAHDFEALAPGDSEDDAARRGDELDQLQGLFEAIARRLSGQRQALEDNQASLRRAYEDLELRVEERTADLSLANAKLREEIVERQRVEQRLEQMSLTDFLTDALNRRAMSRRLEQQAALNERTGTPFSLVLLDVDQFKQVNDRYGHEVGDRVLTGLVGRLRKDLRPSDELARWGGEEFLILLPGTGLAQAVGLAERLRSRLAEHPLPTDAGAIRVTASFGVARFRAGDGLNACLKRADDALYRAKGEGRDRVVAEAD